MYIDTVVGIGLDSQERSKYGSERVYGTGREIDFG